MNILRSKSTKAIINKIKIIFGGINIGKAFSLAFLALILFPKGIDDWILNTILGVNSTVVIYLIVGVIAASIFFTLLTTNFEYKNAVATINLSKKIAFQAAFSLLTIIAAPILFMILASLIYAEWKLLLVFSISLVFFYAQLFLFILGLKDIHRGMRRELINKNPPTILL